MKCTMFTASLIKSALAASLLLAASGSALASSVTLTAAPTSTTLPDGQTVPMWGYACGAVTAATCTAATGVAQAGGVWQPPLITVASGADLTITLNNSLTFATIGLPNNIPTSLVIVGQLGGGLGDVTQRTTMSGPVPHLPQGTTWPGTPGAAGACGTEGTFCPPDQQARIRSFATEVAPGGSEMLVWTAANLRPGTYLIQSGTQPSIQGPMGLYGVLVVTDGTYPGVTRDQDVALLLSEIDPVQNISVDTAVRTDGFNDELMWNGQETQCGHPDVHTCYPPAVNYEPLYFLINGISFDRTSATSSLPAGPTTATTGRVLLRFVNAGSRMHTPSVVGADMTLYAEDGNLLPGVPKVQSQLFLAAGKTYDVTISPAAAGGTYAAASYAVYDRALSLSTDNQRDGGMQAYLHVNGGATSGAGSSASATSATANPDTYYKVTGNPLVVANLAQSVVANDVGIYGVQLFGGPVAGLNLNPNGTFTYTGAPSAFTYCGNGDTSGVAPLCAEVTLAACGVGCLGGEPVAYADDYTSNVATRLQIGSPGVLENDTDPSGFPLKAVNLLASTCDSVVLEEDGSFTATAAAPGSCTFTYNAQNSQNTASLASATVTLTFPTATGLAVTVKDGKTGETLADDYRWIIEEDRTVFIDPAVETDTSGTPVRNLALNFHTSHMPVVAQGCVVPDTGGVSCEAGQTLLGVAAVCDLGNGKCRTDATARTPINPGEVYLDPAKRYHITILPADGWITDDVAGGHTMGGANIAAGQTAVDVLLEKTPLEPAKISVYVFQDDAPLNGEHDGGGGVDALAPNEAGLGGFNIVLLDQAGNRGDNVGQITYDMFGMPVNNSLANTLDPATGLDACPISPTATDGLVGMIVTCPKYESDGTTLSPLAGHAIIANMYAGFYEVVTAPGADRIARGEEWLQTNTLDGTKAIEAFIKPSEPSYFQEFGPGGYHVAVGFASPAVINARKNDVCPPGGACTGNFYGMVTGLRMSRTPDQRVYSSGSYTAYSFAQCYVSLGAAAGDGNSMDFAFAKCNADGTFEFLNIPLNKNLRVTVFDQWNDLLVDGLSTPIRSGATGPGSSAGSRMEIPVTEWRTNLYGRVFLDQNGDGVSQDEEPGLPLVPYNIRFRDGSYAGYNNTDLAGFAGFNEVFPYVNWLVVDIDSARHKLTGIHVVYDAGGPVDGTTGGGSSTIAAGIANSTESPTAHVPEDLRFPGSRYCASADCPLSDPDFDPDPLAAEAGSTGRVDPGWVGTEGWQGLLGQSSFIEFAMKPFLPNENGGIKGIVTYTPTRPFDDPALLFHLSWAPGIPNVTVNLYRKGTSELDGSQTLTLVDTTTSDSWDDWAQGFRSDGVPNMNCPGQENTNSPFYFTLENSTQWLAPTTDLPNDAQFKCYDGWAMLNQVQPATYNGKYTFPSVTARDPITGAQLLTDTNCTICSANPDDGTPMLPRGNYVVEVVVPPGYELVKEEDKNILIGDAYIAPVTTQFAGYGNIFIMPDQAAINAFYNPINVLQSTTNNGAVPRREGDTGSIEVFWPCAGEQRIVPDLISLYPGAEQQAPFAGATRPLCDRKEVLLGDQMTVLTKFYLFSSTHVTGHFTGIITNDFASEFNPFSPQFGEKFAVPNTPVAIKDFTGKEIYRVYSDQWGLYNGLNYSTFSVWPPSPSGYIPQMMIACMNDPGPIPDPSGAIDPDTLQVRQIIDPAYNPAYSDFCYEIPFMPGQTVYLDTPVVPTMGFAAGYNLPDVEYPDTTPAIAKAVSNDVQGPWVSGDATDTLTITALGNQRVLNHAYSGPNATTAPYNQKYVTRSYGFGGQCTAVGTGCAVVSSVTIGGVNAPITSWSDTAITVTVPALTVGQSSCTIQQRGVSTATRCGQLVITRGNGKKSIDALTVTIGGKPPTYVTPASPSNTLFGRLEPSPVQTAIDNASAGDLIILGPGTYRENLLMWKPVRLQGVGATAVTINGDAHPAGKLDSWRRQVNCLFGLAINGQPIGAGNPYDVTHPDGTDAYTCPASMRQQVDRNPRQAIVGWDVTGNGNLAQMLQEPTLMGAYEGAGVTILGKGVWIPLGSEQFGIGTEGIFPPGYRYLNGNTGAGANNDCRALAPTNVIGRDFTTANFLCNPSRIDGVSVINSSQGGGAIFATGWNHSLEVANTRVHGNHGTLTGGITIGTPELTIPFIVGGIEPIPFAVPGGLPAGLQLGYGLNRNVRVHHNAVTNNASLGDALYSGTPSAAGGVTFSAGADGYTFNNNWVAGNLSSGDGGGVVHAGFSNDGRILNNWILFNQTASPTIPTNGGGLGILGAAADRTLSAGPNAGLECGSVDDIDCPPGFSEGTGRNLVVDANLIMGNSAESGTGGGLRLQKVNGDDVLALPTNSARWNDVLITNNIIANNVAGWDGGGVSLQDALKVRFINNTVISNDTTASAGVLFNTLGAPYAATPPPGCAPADLDPVCNPTPTSTNQVAGLVTMENTPYLVAALPPNAAGTQVACPTGYGYGSGAVLSDGLCRNMSLPLLRNNLFWQNRAFHIGVAGLGTGQQEQQSVVTLYPLLTQTLTGMCDDSGTGDPFGTGINASALPVYWDIGVRGDTSPTPNSGSGFTLTPNFSILTNAAAYPGANNLPNDPLVLSKYCNGSRLPPEGGGSSGGFIVPPGRSESTGLYPIFALNQITAAASVDEGNNWINLGYGPLSLANAATAPAAGTLQAPLGNYDIPNSSPAYNNGGNGALAPNHDFFGRARPLGGAYDIGAAEFTAAAVPPPAFPTLTVRDTFTRANANTLGANWQQLVVLGNAGIRVNATQAFCVNTGAAALLCALGANAYWNLAPQPFGARQAAAFTFANTTLDNAALYLKAGGTFALGTYANAIRVRYSVAAGGVVVETTTNGLTFTTAGTLAGSFASGDTLTALADATGIVFVWKTSGATTTYLGNAGLPTTGANAFTLGTGRIGLFLPPGARVDNFAGGTVP